MNAVFEMYLAKELKVLIGPAYALEDAAETHRDLESRKSTEKLYFLLRDEREANENHGAHSKRTSEIRKGPTRNGAASLQP